MPENISLILNVLLLLGVVTAILFLMKARRQAQIKETPVNQTQPSLGSDMKNFDDIIAVRKIIVDEPSPVSAQEKPKEKVEPVKVEPVKVEPQKIEAKPESSSSEKTMKQGQTLMLFLVAKDDRQLAGYELLQTLLASGLRFGEGNLFHRHVEPNGQGAVLCSLAAATPTGFFDLQNIGAFSVRGLCLYMQVSSDPLIDEQRLKGMLKTARQLSEGLDTRLLDNQKQLFTKETISRYHRLLNLTETEI